MDQHEGQAALAQAEPQQSQRQQGYGNGLNMLVNVLGRSLPKRVVTASIVSTAAAAMPAA